MESIENYLKECGLKLKLHKNQNRVDITNFRNISEDAYVKRDDILIINRFENMIGTIYIEDWKRYYAPKKELNKETEEEMSYIFAQYYLISGGSGKFKINISTDFKANFEKIQKEKFRAVNELIKGWEIESLFMNEEEILSNLDSKLCLKISEIIKKSGLSRKLEEELPSVIMGKNINKR